MMLCDLLSPWIKIDLTSIEITGIAVDHRLVKPGFLFFANCSTQENSEDYINGAIKNGAAAVIYDAKLKVSNVKVPNYPLENLSSALCAIASRFYHNPFKHIHTVGVTGTNGKTTVAYLLMQSYILLGQEAAYIGTLGVGNLKKMRFNGLTTPGPLEINAYARDLASGGVNHLAMEVSSHGLDQGRVSSVPFEQAIFMNLTHDHLDYHRTFENYANAKAKLFAFPSLKAIILNADDPMTNFMLENANKSTHVYTFGFNKQANIQVIKKEWSLKGMHLECKTPWGNVNLKAPLIGDFNVYNILAVFTSLMASGYELSKVVDVIHLLQSAPGRMQVVSTKPLVIVDYAHTPDALEKVLKTLKEFKTLTNANRLWVVFGCGGDRDALKRPIMGKIASTESDIVVVTSDNPRHENPESIIQQVMEGVPKVFTRKLAIEDRKLAIITALQEATDKDIILIAGKGHEDYQQIGDTKHFFSDQFVVKEYFSSIKI